MHYKITYGVLKVNTHFALVYIVHITAVSIHQFYLITSCYNNNTHLSFEQYICEMRSVSQCFWGIVGDVHYYAITRLFCFDNVTMNSCIPGFGVLI